MQISMHTYLYAYIVIYKFTFIRNVEQICLSSWPSLDELDKDSKSQRFENTHIQKS